MAGKDIDIQVYLNAVKTEAQLVVATVKDKGGKRFGKAFGMSAVMIVVAYFGIYNPPQSKISRLNKEIETARTMSESGATYKDIRGQLMGSYGDLPLMKDRQQWLSNAVIDSLRAEDLTPEMFRPVVETEADGLIFQTSAVQISLKFDEVYRWIQRLEGATPLMHVELIEISKKSSGAPGVNTVSASIVTTIPKMRYE
ncbi:MAG: hypothetical protein COV48_05105 [Elusimicrobia bacterium CG11_big_fil_rev_8_21_14_0_20_64_6]|nr:MAG: hypothetical protein COV48_05105 [Elusimicrobia bacterium CG11_big_fil_rev_8_21_14_0_20_64_6]